MVSLPESIRLLIDPLRAARVPALSYAPSQLFSALLNTRPLLVRQKSPLRDFTLPNFLGPSESVFLAKSESVFLAKSESVFLAKSESVFLAESVSNSPGPYPSPIFTIRVLVLTPDTFGEARPNIKGTISSRFCIQIVALFGDR
jgi:hypothetical protein